MASGAWATTFLTHQLLHYLDAVAPDAVRAIDFDGLLTGVEGFEPPDDPVAFLRDPHHWLPEPLLRRALTEAERAAGNKMVAYEAALHYFNRGRSASPSLLELVALAFADVGGMVAHSHLWAGAYTTYLRLQALVPRQASISPDDERHIWLLSRLDSGVPAILSAHHFLRGNYEGFTRLYDWVETVACEADFLQQSLEEIAAEFSGASVRWEGETARLFDAAGAVVAEGREIRLHEARIVIDPAAPAGHEAAAIAPLREQTALLLRPPGPAAASFSDASGAHAVEITAGGVLTSGPAGPLQHRFRAGEIYGAPYSCYRFRWRERPRAVETTAGSVRQEFSFMILQALQQVQAVRRELLSATIGRQQLAAENLSLRRRLEQPGGHPNILGRSGAIRDVCRMVDLLAGTDTTALIMGETGTGKEVVAQAIHRQSARASEPFLAVNCGALTESLLESELFGHEKGAFTGAISRRRGAFELAHGGTLLLDEIGEIPPAMQVKLLRVLQEREFLRVGGERPITVDVRVIAATNQPLERCVADGRFRQDLYFRLKVVPVTVPPLRERRDDIPLLAEHFLREYAGRLKRRVTAIGPDAMTALLDYAWPGNVRELRHAIERAVLLAGDQTALTRGLLPPEMQASSVGACAEKGEEVSAEEIPEKLRFSVGNAPTPQATIGIPSAAGVHPVAAESGGIYVGIGDWARCAELLKQHGSLDELLARVEWQIVSTAMAAHGGNKSRAAKALGRSYRWLRKLESRVQPPGH
jgi:transcriptional regulator with GAF, ATPase, and Fis domain